MSNLLSIETDFTSEFVETSQHNALNTICYLPSFWCISILNLYKYLKAQINLRFSLSVEDIDSIICLAIPNAVPSSINIKVGCLENTII